MPLKASQRNKLVIRGADRGGNGCGGIHIAFSPGLDGLAFPQNRFGVPVTPRSGSSSGLQAFMPFTVILWMNGRR